MASFQDTMKEFVNMDYSKLLAFAKIATNNVLPACKVVDEENGGMAMFTSIILSAIGADGTLTGLERNFLKDLFDFEDEDVENMISLYNGDMMEEVTDKFVDSLGDENKAHTLTLCLCLCAVDETISREENAFLNKLMA